MGITVGGKNSMIRRVSSVIYVSMLLSESSTPSLNFQPSINALLCRIFIVIGRFFIDM